ncbi:hypothetical protein PSV09DRAFT_2274887 [Bipolaris maydis]|nr:hypothetical protein PSV09DRAFT_2274887 [Bipolaris maydis]
MTLLSCPPPPPPLFTNESGVFGCGAFLLVNLSSLLLSYHASDRFSRRRKKKIVRSFLGTVELVHGSLGVFFLLLNFHL